VQEKLRFSRKTWFVVILCVFVLPLSGYYGIKAWTYYATHVTTDNAYVEVMVAQITPRIPGAVAEVLVEDNWWVKPGQALVRLDPQEYEVHVADAKATLQKAHEAVDQLFAATAVAEERTKEATAQVAASQAQLATAQAEFHQADLDLQRAQQLSAQEIISVRQLDLAKTQYNVTLSRLNTQQKQLEQSRQARGTRAKELEQSRAALGAATTTERSAHSLAKQAEAALREAELNLSYCTLVAPIEGIVSRKSVEVGQRIQPGQPLMAVVPLHHVYIEANYKETQLTDVRVGQPAEIRADIYPDHVYRGKVDSLSAGTGAAFSLLPPENATGNWVKVVQRLPVKITLAEPPPADKPLRIGLSVEVTINISDRQGPLLSSLLQEEGQRRNSLSPTDGIKPARLNSPLPFQDGGSPSSRPE
jgi:membrane fusion protein (multidrug efflux system)